MSKKHSDEIRATLDVLQTDEGRAHAFSYLLGVLSSKAEDGRPVSATRLAEAVVRAVESASKIRAEERARAEEQAWRAADEAEEGALTLADYRSAPAYWERKAEEAGEVVAAVESARGAAERARTWRPATEAELPEPREIPDLDPSHFSHAMAGVGDETSWCGAPGRVAVLASNVTCPVCRTMLSRENEGDPGARSPWWCTIYISTTDGKTYISDPFQSPTGEDASALTAQSSLAQEVVNVTGPFTKAEADAYREAWLHAAKYGQNRQLIAEQAVISHGREAQRYVPESGYGSAPFRPCADCYSPLSCEEGDEERCP